MKRREIDLTGTRVHRALRNMKPDDPTTDADVVEAETLYTAAQRGHHTVAQVAAIDARVEHGRLPWWRRWRARRPPGWRR